MRVRLLFGILTVPFVVSACSVTPKPLTDADREARIVADRATIAEIAPLAEPTIDLYDAMARAVAFNLTHRQKLLETAIAAGIADVQSYDMLPELAADAGLTHRSNDYATVGRDLTTGVTDDSYSTSTDRTQATSSLKLSWNVLDFGVSYLQAHQNADRILIAQEKRRKAVQTILRDVQSAWLRAVVAERLSRDLMPLITRVEKALENARIIEERRLIPPMQALEAQRQLLDILRSLQDLRRDLVGAKTNLARLLNIPPGTPFRIDMPADLQAAPDIGDDLSALIDRALRDRPELRQEDYQARISADETRKAMLRMLPGLELSIGANWDDNSFVKNATWADAGLFLAWNLMNLVSGPSNIALAEQREDAANLRRLALHMAVVGQVAVAWEQLHLARESLALANRIHEVDERIYGHTAAGAETQVQTEIQLIRTEAARLASRARRDMAYAEREEALAALRVSIGDDPLEIIDSVDLDDGIAGLRSALKTWHSAMYGAPVPAQGGPGAVVDTPDGAEVEWTIEGAVTPADDQGGANVEWIIETPGVSAPVSTPGPAEVEWIIESTDGPEPVSPTG